MSTFSIVAAISLVFACIVPIVILKRKGDKKRKKLTQTLKEFAKERSADLHEVEVWNNSAIGIDKEKGKIFYLQNNDQAQVYQHIDFADIRQCQLVDTRRRVSEKEGGYQAIERLALDFNFHDKSRPGLSLEFYSIQRDQLSVADEYQLAIKWHQQINGMLQTGRKVERWHF